MAEGASRGISWNFAQAGAEYMSRDATDAKHWEREAGKALSAGQRVQQTLGVLARAAVGKPRGHEQRGRCAEWEGMPERVEPRDELLLQRMATGDEEAFHQFYNRHHAPVYQFALHMTGRREAAEEVVQEAFMTLIQKADKFEAERGEPKAFLFGIARMHVRRLAERERRYEPLTDEANLQEEAGGRKNGHAPRESLLGELTREETVAQVRRAVTMLPEHYREVVTLCDLQARDYATAAKMLDCPIGTVRSRLARGREILAARLRAVPAGAKKPSGGSF